MTKSTTDIAYIALKAFNEERACWRGDADLMLDQFILVRRPQMILRPYKEAEAEFIAPRGPDMFRFKRDVTKEDIQHFIDLRAMEAAVMAAMEYATRAKEVEDFNGEAI